MRFLGGVITMGLCMICVFAICAVIAMLLGYIFWMFLEAVRDAIIYGEIFL